MDFLGRPQPRASVSKKRRPSSHKTFIRSAVSVRSPVVCSVVSSKTLSTFFFFAKPRSSIRSNLRLDVCKEKREALKNRDQVVPPPASGALTPRIVAIANMRCRKSAKG